MRGCVCNKKETNQLISCSTETHYYTTAFFGTYFTGALSAPVMNAHSPLGLGGSGVSGTKDGLGDSLGK